eukprot:1161843-Pelagomonas_calceolata.AAC.3
MSALTWKVPATQPLLPSRFLGAETHKHAWLFPIAPLSASLSALTWKVPAMPPFLPSRYSGAGSKRSSTSNALAA